MVDRTYSKSVWIWAVIAAVVLVTPVVILDEVRSSPGSTTEQSYSHVRAASWSTQVTAYETAYCLYQNDTHTLNLGGEATVKIIDLLPTFTGVCASTQHWRFGGVFELLSGSTVESVLFASVNNTTTPGQFSAGQSHAFSDQVGILGYANEVTQELWFNYTKNGSSDKNPANSQMSYLAAPGGGDGAGSSSTNPGENSGSQSGAAGCGCTCDVWDGMYFEDYAVAYPHDDNQCYNHPNTQTWWAYGTNMAHFTYGSNDVSLLNSLGPVAMGAAIGAAVGARGGMEGAAAGALLGALISALLIYKAQNVWIDENNDIHWWSNDAFFDYLHNNANTVWVSWLFAPLAQYEAYQAEKALTYLRVGNSDYANVNSVVDPS